MDANVCMPPKRNVADFLPTLSFAKPTRVAVAPLAVLRELLVMAKVIASIPPLVE